MASTGIGIPSSASGSSTISDILDDIRIELNDEQKSRWELDATLVKLVAKSIRRLSHILQRNEIPFARKYYTVTTASGTADYDLPDDFMAVVGLFRDSTDKEIDQYSDAAFERIASATELAAYCIRDGQIKIDSAPTGEETLTLIYWPKIDTSAYSTATETPWDGRLDDLIAEYCALRCKNIDEMDLTIDAQLMSDLENNVLSTYGTLNPTMSTMRGWLPTTYEESDG